MGKSDGGAAEGGNATPTPGGPCPRCVKIFDGTTLDGWIPAPANSWNVLDGTMNSLKLDGHIYTAKDYGNVRLFFSVRQVSGNHQPGILLFGTRPASPAQKGARGLNGIQFQPPNGYAWDYRPGRGSPGALFSRPSKPSFNKNMWHQCEVLIKEAGTIRAACCPLTGSGPCGKAVECFGFKDPSAGKKAPIAWQIHNNGINDQYKDVYVEENPEVDDLLSTK